MAKELFNAFVQQSATRGRAAVERMRAWRSGSHEAPQQPPQQEETVFDAHETREQYIREQWQQEQLDPAIILERLHTIPEDLLASMRAETAHRIDDVKAFMAFGQAGHSLEELQQFVEERTALYVYYLPGVPKPTLEQIQAHDHPDYKEERNRATREHHRELAAFRQEHPELAVQLETMHREFAEKMTARLNKPFRKEDEGER